MNFEESILLACEESQETTKRLIESGFSAYSCDILHTSGPYPERHFQGDVREILHHPWKLVIAHPPCTRLANSGVRWLASRKERAGYRWCKREKIYLRDDAFIWQELAEAINFFNLFVKYGMNGGRIRIENPIQHKYARRHIIKHHQVLQPHDFGHGETKAHCFWNFNISDLKPTNKVAGREARIHKMPPSKDRAKQRSKTFPGIAEALATQLF